MIRRLIALFCCWLLVAPALLSEYAWAVNVKQVRELYWRATIPLIQPLQSAQIVMPASGTTAGYTYFGPFQVGVITTAGAIFSPIGANSIVSRLNWTANSNNTAAGTATIELFTSTPATAPTLTDTNYGCTITIPSSGTVNPQCVCTPQKPSQCTHAGVTRASLTTGQLVTWKFTVGTITNWNGLLTQIAWNLTPSAGSQTGQLFSGGNTGNSGPGALTSYLGPSNNGGGSPTESSIEALEPNLGIYITGFTIWTQNISDTSPGHTWTLRKNGADTAIKCNTIVPTTAKSCTATGGPVYIGPTDTFSVSVVGTSSSIAVGVFATLAFTTTVPGASPIFVMVGSSAQTSAFFNPQGGVFTGAQPTETTTQGVTPEVRTSYTVSNLTFFQTLANSAAHIRTATLRAATPSAGITNQPLSCAMGSTAATNVGGGGTLSGVICTSSQSVVLSPSVYMDWNITATSGSAVSGFMRISAVAVVQ